MVRKFFTGAITTLVINLLAGCASDLPLTELKKYEGDVGYGMAVLDSTAHGHVLRSDEGICSENHDPRCGDGKAYRVVATWITNGFPKLTHIYVLVPSDIAVEKHDIIKFKFATSNDPKHVGGWAEYVRIIKAADQGPNCEWKGPGLMLQGHVECEDWNPFHDAPWLNL